MSTTRRDFIKTSSVLAAGSFLPFSRLVFEQEKQVKLCAHLWVYASKFPPNWDATPALEDVFSDLKYAGYKGVELMDSVLRNDSAEQKLKELIKKHKLPVTGSSYTGALWNKEKHVETLKDIELVTDRLQRLGGTTFGITTGNAGRKKTEAELDAQAEILKDILAICKSKKLSPNIHNHTWEVENDLYELKGIISRVPEIKLGPDLNWLVRGGVDPVWFIKTYGDKMVYMHLRDQDATGTWTEAVGEGVTDFKAIQKALSDINYEGWAAVELAYHKPPVKSTRENWKKSRDYVAKLFQW